MNPESGRIYLDLPEEEAKRKGLIPIPADQAERIVNMNRKQRRAWAASQRRKVTA